MQGDEPRPIYNWLIPMMEQLLRRLSQYLALVVSSIVFPEIVGIDKQKCPEDGENHNESPNKLFSHDFRETDDLSLTKPPRL